MGLVIDLEQVIDRYVGISLCGGQACVAEQLLNGAQVGAPVEQVCGAGMPERMRVQVCATRSERAVRVHHFLNLPHAQPLASAAQTKRSGLCLVSAEKLRSAAEVSLQCVDTMGAERHEALLVPLAHHAHGCAPVCEMDVRQIQPAELRHTQARAIEQLQERAVAQALGGI